MRGTIGSVAVPVAVAVAVAAAVAIPTPLFAQAAITPPPMLQVTCETVKAGMGPAHDRHEERWARMGESVKGVASTLAVQSATGPVASCWLTSVASYDAIAKNNQMLGADATYSAALPGLMQGDAAFVSDVRSYVATLRPDLSAGEMPNVLSRRAMMWGEWRVRPGPGEALFEAAVKAYRDAAIRAGLSPQYRVYQVRQGAPGATFWIFNSGSSMGQFDAIMAGEPKIAASFTPADLKVFDDYFAKSHMSMVENLWTYNPAQSTLTAEQRASDPFWKRKGGGAKQAAGSQ